MTFETWHWSEKTFTVQPTLVSKCLKFKIKEAKSRSGKEVVNLSGTPHSITKLSLEDLGLAVKGLIYQGDSHGKKLLMK